MSGSQQVDPLIQVWKDLTCGLLPLENRCCQELAQNHNFGGNEHVSANG
jgi:hypothetical protein